MGKDDKDIFVFKAGKARMEERITFSKYPGVSIEHNKTIELSKEDQQTTLIKEYIQNGKEDPSLKSNSDVSRLIKVSKPGEEHEQPNALPQNNLANEFDALLKSDASKDDINDWAARNLPKLTIKASMKKDQMVVAVIDFMRKSD